jgi:hypothetical protein
MTTTEVRTDDPTGTIIRGNGAIVLEYTEQYQAGPGWRRSGIAICYWANRHDPFVTWRLIQAEDGMWFAEAGTYHRKFDQELLDTYNERVNR